MIRLFIFCLILIACTACHKQVNNQEMISIQIMDRNGLSETVSNKDRLRVYDKVDFLAAQPFKKVLRVYSKNDQGKSRSKVTSYHNNGGVYQLLEAVDGRAHGIYREWHENGNLKVDGYVIEGMADLSDVAQKSWLFDGECRVWNDEGAMSAHFIYNKGNLTGVAKYFFPNGKLQKTVPYKQDLIHGTVHVYDESAHILEEAIFVEGKREGEARGYWEDLSPKFVELYKADLLLEATYFDKQGEIVAQIQDGTGVNVHFENGYIATKIQYEQGIPSGEVQLLTPSGHVRTRYQIHNEKKTGEEWEYYSTGKPKMLLTWHDDQIQGMAKTWYPSGELESQREMSGNKKHGISFAYYKNGDLMLMEQYENDKLVKGSYYAKGQKDPVSAIEQGIGIATLYTPDGHFFKKIEYQLGKPLVE